MDKRTKKAVISFSTVVAVIILAALINHFSHLNKALLDIKFTPYEAAVFIDGRNGYTNNSSVYLEKGQHEVTVFLNGFALYNETVEVTDKTKSITGELSPISELGVQIALEHAKDSADLDNYITEELEENWEEEKKTYPILEYIPYTNKAYGIGYKNDDGNFILTITADNPLVDVAVNKLRSFDKSISLAKYNFEINDFKNVLAGNFKSNSASDPTEYLKSGYAGIDETYTVNAGSRKNNYYYTTISVGAYAGYIPVTYRVVLMGDGSSWELASDPYPLLTISNTPNIPVEVLDAANRLDAPTVYANANEAEPQ